MQRRGNLRSLNEIKICAPLIYLKPSARNWRMASSREILPALYAAFMLDGCGGADIGTFGALAVGLSIGVPAFGSVLK